MFLGIRSGLILWLSFTYGSTAVHIVKFLLYKLEKSGDSVRLNRGGKSEKWKLNRDGNLRNGNLRGTRL